MDKSEELDLRKAFAKPGAKLRFRRLAGFHYVSDEDVEVMIAQNDGVAFRDGLLNGREPAFEVSWGALWHGNSGSFEIHHFEGFFFAKSEDDGGIAGPFESVKDAAEWRAGIYDMDYSEEYGTAASVHITSRYGDEGQRLISKREANKVMEILTSHEDALLDFYWCEAEPGKLFKDPLHGEAGKLLTDLHDAQRDGRLDNIFTTRQKLEKLTKKDRADDYVLGEASKHFTTIFDSCLMKVPMDAAGKLARFRAEWVRICMPRRVGKKTLATVIRIDNPMDLIDDLVPAHKPDHK